MKDRDVKDYWSDCGQIFFHYSRGYGLTDTLRPICLGCETDIMKYLNTGEVNKNSNPKQLEVLNQIQIFRKEQGIGTTNIRTADMERAVNNGSSRRKPKATRLLTARKRLPLRPPRTKNKSLSRRRGLGFRQTSC